MARYFKSGATRDDADYKLDYEAFFNPRVLEIYAEFMHKHRKQTDGKLRDGDNWQKGFGKDVVAKSLVRHMIEFWKDHRGYDVFDRKTGEDVDMKDTLCAIIFNAFAYLKEYSEEEEQFTKEERESILQKILK